MKLKLFGLLPALLLAGVSGLASPVEPLAVEHVIANAPPLQLEILSVLLDRGGFLWIGSQNGLLRYDGYHATPVKLDDGAKTTAAHSSVRSICEGPDGRLWLATAAGLVSFDPARRTAVRFRHDRRRPDTLSADDITCLHISRAYPKDLWIATANGDLDRMDLDGGTISRYPAAAAGAPRPGRIHVVSGDDAGFIWIGAANGLYHFLPSAGRLRFCPSAENVPGSRESFAVTAVFYDGTVPDTLWIGSDRAGLFRYFPDAGLWRRAVEERSAGGLADEAGIRAIASFPGRAHDLLVGTQEGLYHFDRRLGRFERMALLTDLTDLQPSLCTQVIHRDRRGIYWLGSCRNGLDKWSPAGKKFSRIAPFADAAHAPLANHVTSMQELASGGILLTTLGGGALTFDRRSASFRRLLLDPGRPERKLNSSIIGSSGDSDGILWFASAEGLARCSVDGRLQRLYRFEVNDVAKPEFVLSTYSRDRSGRHWLGSNRGLLRIDVETGQQRLFRHDRRNPKSLSHDRVNAILAVGDDLWVGSDDGLNLLRSASGEFAVFKNDADDPDSLSSNLITCLMQDSLGRIWICSAGGFDLVIRKENEVRFRRYRAPGNDPRQNNFLAVVEEDRRHFWLGTKAGLARFDSGRGTFVFYDQQDGVAADGADEALFFFRSRDSEIFFGGRNGFTSFRPSDFNFNPHPPPLVVTELRIEQPLASATSGPAAGRKNVRVELAALDFVRPEKNQYAYRLEGRDRDWTYQGTDRVVLLSGLPVGSYTLRAKAANNDGLWNEEVFSLRIRVRPPFHEQYKFVILAAVLLAGVVFFGLRRRSKRPRSTGIPGNLDLVLEKFSISKREAEIVRLLLAGKSNKEIEDALFIALATVKNHVHSIFRKMKVNNRLQLLLRIEQEAKKFK